MVTNIVEVTPSLLPCQRFGVGPPLVLVHGYLGGSAQWASELPILGKYFEVFTLDLAGYGKANHLTARLQIAHHAQDILATLSHYGVDRFHLLGHSMGGMIVQEIAHQAPQRVKKLVLYATGSVGCIPGRFETMERSRERLSEDGLQHTAKRICATWLLHRESSPAFESLANLAMLSTLQAAMAGLHAMESWNGRKRLKYLNHLTLIIWGEHDRSYTWSQIETLWRNIPHASLAVLPSCSHALHLEKSSFFCALLVEFLMCSDSTTSASSLAS